MKRYLTMEQIVDVTKGTHLEKLIKDLMDKTFHDTEMHFLYGDAAATYSNTPATMTAEKLVKIIDDVYV